MTLTQLSPPEPLARTPRGDAPARASAGPGRLVDLFERGLDAPICLTWELTYACNLSCVHCLSSSGRRDPRELSTDECKAVIDTLQRMQVFRWGRRVRAGTGRSACRARPRAAKPCQERESCRVRSEIIVDSARAASARA